MNLADPELEYIDPTPNVHSLFIHFDTVFFSTALAGKAVVRWSKRMYSCAGVCSYEGRGGICDIALSEPLLKLRPRKDLVETLLHEMIHAYLFVIRKDQSRDGHGPNFLSHMHRINNVAGLNISVYHEFHDEVHLYQTHWWRCNGPCQTLRPYFGIVRRTMNKAPGPSDHWWKDHMRKCGGIFTKIKEPEKVEKPKKTAKVPKKVMKPNADITKYINNNNKTISNKNTNMNNIQGFKDLENEKKNTSSVSKITTPKEIAKPVVFTGIGQFISGNRPNSGVAETVRNIWANKTIPSVNSGISKGPAKISTSNITNKHKILDKTNSDSPPKKIKKIDDYFIASATSLLKDVYGKDFKIIQSSNTSKLTPVISNEKFVDCPICNAKVSDKIINSHIDECLNKDVIEKLSKENVVPSTSQTKPDINIKRRDTIGVIHFEPKNFIDLTKSSNTRHSINNIDIKDKVFTTNICTNDFDIEPEIKTEPSYTRNPINNIKDKVFTTNEHIIDSDIKPEIKIEKNTDVRNKTEPGPSKESLHTCPCCGIVIDKPVQEHLDECLMFFDNNTTIPEEGASTSFGDRTIVIDDSDDEFDETQTFNATGTKTPCPCCMKMVESAEMNDHLDLCLGIS